MRLSLSRIEAAYLQLNAEFRHTPQYQCEPLGDALGCRVTLKVETLNPVRSFKGRGSQIAVSQARQKGYGTVVCASAGNLGQAVAYCARVEDLSCVVYASRTASQVKLRRIKALGATLRLVDGDIETAREAAKEASSADGAYLIEDSENVATCEGAATMGIELAEDRSAPFDDVLIALGGGAMATGIGLVLKNRCPSTRIVCVQPKGAPAMTLSWREKTVIHTDSIDTIADGVAGRHPVPEVLDDLLEVADDAVLVDESSIIEGMRLLYRHAGLVVEPSAALGVAAILETPSRFVGRDVALIICGSNVDPVDFKRWVIDSVDAEGKPS